MRPAERGDLPALGRLGAGREPESWKELRGPAGFIHDVMVEASERGQGIATRLGVHLVDGNYETFKLSTVLTPDGDADGALVSLSASDQMGVMQSWMNYEGITPPSEITLSLQRAHDPPLLAHRRPLLHPLSARNGNPPARWSPRLAPGRRP